MNKFFLRHRQLVSILCFVLGVLLSIGACGVLASHASLFSQKRDTAVMIGTQLPELKSAVALLAANVEAEKLFASQALAAREEQASAYILPKGSPSERTVTTLQEISRALGTDGDLTLEKITFAPAPKDEGSFKRYTANVVFRGSFQKIARMLAILGYGSDMVVRDAVSPEDQDLLLRIIEQSAPLSLSRATNFLYLDLMQYASSPDKSEDRMLDGVPTTVASDVRAMLLTAGLSHVRSAFSGIAAGLFEKGLWPTPLMDVRHVERSGDRWTIELSVYGR